MQAIRFGSVCASALTMVACDVAPLHAVGVSDDAVSAAVDANGQTDAVLAVTNDAIDLWARHGLAFDLTDSGAIVVYASASDRDGFVRLSDGGAQIFVAVHVTSYNQTCMVAKELGLAVGLDAVSGSALLGNVPPPVEQPCPWSPDDQASVDAFLGH